MTLHVLDATDRKTPIPVIGTPASGDSGAGLQVAESALSSGPIYQDATYKYFGEAAPGTGLTDTAWRVSRMRLSDSYIQWADGDGYFDNVFTDLSTVAALTFA